ncbi:hypothetical protein GGS23DRAFT_72237 [Durotheca rogersii]|uniref:uncharacterized protein n=1 Tax=Durotheca rogersii TaxID=419775 RepID=UPI00221F62D4|nr:uncharacterized protein GGS23DRAFT_72237 [Durotheca rogersii]KAI5862864.1 hypothetical protein GGS23DRAFT_72237 [Durotheca rogersii]
MDWLGRLQAFGTAILYPALRFTFNLCYLVTIPLHYPIYYLLALVTFLLSPIWYMFRVVLSVASTAVGLVVRLKYLYIYLACAAIIGICAGCMLHGTSSFIFVLLGIDASQQHRSGRRRARLPPVADEDEELYGLESTPSKSSVGGMAPRRGKPKREADDDTRESLRQQWKLPRPSKIPGQQRRGLISQTIYEESSSDFS